MKRILYATLLVTALALGQARGALVTFDDVNLPPGGIDININGYAGFNWINFYLINTTAHYENQSESAGTISKPNLVWSSSATGTAMVGIHGPFTLNSAYLTDTDYNVMELEVIGVAGGTTLYDNTYTLGIGTPTLVNFDYVNVDEVMFRPTVPDWFVMDNVTVNEAVPESITMVEGALALLWPFGLRVVLTLRNRKQAA